MGVDLRSSLEPIASSSAPSGVVKGSKGDRGGAKVGEVVDPLPPLLSVDGARYSSDSFVEKSLLIYAFLGDACPAVKALVPKLIELQRTFESKAIQIIAINTNNEFLSPTDSIAEMTRRAEEWGLNFPYLKDANHEIALRLGVTNTPHFVVLDARRRLRYRGRMFDSRDPGHAGTSDLYSAVETILENRAIEVPETLALGCSIVW